MGEPEILSAEQEKIILDAFNEKRRAKSGLREVTPLPGFHDIAQEHCLAMVKKGKTDTEGFNDRAQDVFALGLKSYNEGVGRLGCSSNPEKAIQEVTANILKGRAADIDNASVCQLGIVLAKKKNDYYWVIGFGCDDTPEKVIDAQDVEVLPDDPKKALLDAINARRKDKGLGGVTEIPGFEEVTLPHVMEIATGKKKVNTEHTDVRAQKAFDAGAQNYTEGAGQQTLHSDPVKGVQGWIQAVLKARAADIDSPDVNQVGVSVVRHKADYVWLIGFGKA